jgi:hypothetical protein
MILKGVILLGSETNLKFCVLFQRKFWLMGLANIAQSYFKQMYHIYGFKNGHYSPKIVFYTDISCLGGVFAKNTSRETKNFPRRMAREI